MSGWYGHTIKVNIDDNIRFPKYSGRMSFVNDIISDEVSRVQKRLKFVGAEIAYDIAHRSMVYQRNTITDLGAVRTGRLRDSVRITGNALERNIGTDLFYAETVHDIGYKNQNKFYIDGKTIYGKSDIGPRPWVERSFDAVVSDIDSIVASDLRFAFD